MESSQPMLSGRYLKAWLASLIACILAVILCFHWLDLPVAQFFQHNQDRVQAYGLPSAIIIACELAAITILALIRIRSGRLAAPGKALMIALLSSILAFAANDYVLKLFFGVPTTSEVLFHSTHHGFQILVGNRLSSFPSGHMALAGAFAGVWMRLYPRTSLAFAALLALGMGILVAGDWHFISDVVAGTFVGVTAGLLAGTLWLAHDAGRDG